MRRRAKFADRDEAGLLLAEQLAGMDLAAPLVLALPRGGVPVAAQIARRLDAPLDVAFVRKLGAPGEPELAIGAVGDGDPPEIVLNALLVEERGVSTEFITSAAARELAALEQRRRDYADVRPGVAPSGRTVIVVDDEVATGMTMQAALRSVRRKIRRGCLWPCRLPHGMPWPCCGRKPMILYVSARRVVSGPSARSTTSSGR